MPLVGPKEMFAKAYAGHYAIGAFNVNNMEIIHSPLLLNDNIVKIVGINNKNIG